MGARRLTGRSAARRGDWASLAGALWCLRSRAAGNWARGGVVPASMLRTHRDRSTRRRRRRRAACSGALVPAAVGVRARPRAWPARTACCASSRRPGWAPRRCSSSLQRSRSRLARGWRVATGSGVLGVRAHGASSARPAVLGLDFCARRCTRGALRGMRLPFVVGGAAARRWSLVDRVLALGAPPAAGVRFGLELAAAGAGARSCWARRSRPRRSTNRVVTGGAAAGGHARRLPDLARHDARRSPLALRLRRGRPRRTWTRFADGRARLHAGALDRRGGRCRGTPRC